MPEEIEVETKDLQEAIQELHEEREEREKEQKAAGWTKYIGLTTAILAVFAAVGALQSGSLVNEALIHQVRASDKWNEYQAARQKDHVYTIESNSLVDAGATPPPPKTPDAPVAEKPKAEEKKPAAKAPKSWKKKSPTERLAEYIGQADREAGKEQGLSEEAKKLEEETAKEIEKHHKFAYSVAMIQVAIALGAVAALTRVKSVWWLSIISGAAGIALFFWGFFA